MTNITIIYQVSKPTSALLAALARHNLYQIRLDKYIIAKARQEAGGRRQEENNYSIKTGFGAITSYTVLIKRIWYKKFSHLPSQIRKNRQSDGDSLNPPSHLNASALLPIISKVHGFYRQELRLVQAANT